MAEQFFMHVCGKQNVNLIWLFKGLALVDPEMFDEHVSLKGHSLRGVIDSRVHIEFTVCSLFGKNKLQNSKILLTSTNEIAVVNNNCKETNRMRRIYYINKDGNNFNVRFYDQILHIGINVNYEQRTYNQSFMIKELLAIAAEK
jgi:hypothetical protein